MVEVQLVPRCVDADLEKTTREFCVAEVMSSAGLGHVEWPYFAVADEILERYRLGVEFERGVFGFDVDGCLEEVGDSPAWLRCWWEMGRGRWRIIVGGSIVRCCCVARST